MSHAAGSAPLPGVGLFVHPQHALPDGFPLAAVEAICAPALREAIALARPGAPLAALEEIEVTLVSDRLIADVHVEFMGIEGATDVITFDHGEIIISTETAAVQGADNGNPIGRETALYLIHGLLHLAGYTDKAPDAFAEMARLQEQILARVCPLR